MTSEIEWRRKWKPGLNASTWQPIVVNNEIYLLKYSFTQDSYEIVLSDLTVCWHEELSDTAVKKRIKQLNPGIEAPLTRILDQIQTALDNAQEPSSTSVKLMHKRGADGEEKSLILTLDSELAGLPFTWNFQFSMAACEVAAEHLTLPLMAMVVELSRRQQELIEIIGSKDKEIEDYKSQGAKTSRKHIETPVFVETAFEMNMITSKGFEEQMKDFKMKTFDSKGQDLYRQIMVKKAWLNRSAMTEDATEDESLLDNMSIESSKKTSSSQSWENSRIPPSLQPSKSPTKSPSKTPSPAKAANNTPDLSPVKDTELMRRQALERKLEQDQAKKMEKASKKKKMKF